MRTRLAIFLALTALLVAGCGEKDEPEVTGPPVVTDPGEARRGEPQERRSCPGGDRRVRGSRLRHPAQGRHRALRRRADRPGHPRGAVRQAIDAPRHLRRDRRRRRAGPSLRRVRAGLRALRALLCRLHEHERRHPRGRVPDGREDRQGRRALSAHAARGSTSRSRTTTAACCSSTMTATCSSGSATAARRATRTGTARTSRPSSGRSCGSTPGPGRRRGVLVPKDNPYADESDARPEILAYGLRNPWRFSFDRKTGALWIGDVGQNALEEIDVLAEPGQDANFGWSAFEGTEPFNSDEEAPNAIDPVLTTAGTRAARSRAATSCATVRSARSTAATSTPTSARDSSGASTPKPRRARARRPTIEAARPPGPVDLLVRRGPAWAHLRRLARRARCSGSSRTRASSRNSGASRRVAASVMAG